MKQRKQVLKTDGLDIGYKGKVVARNINMEIFKGQFVSILGPNGSGKTTLLRTLANLLSPVKGRVFIHNRSMEHLSSSEIASSLAVVLTGHAQPGLLTVFEFAALGRYPYTDFLGRLTQEDIRKVEEALDMVGARSIAGRYLSELSDGERQKAVLARALAQDPEVIILDEPTLFLDLKYRVEFITMLRNLCSEREITVVVSLHDPELALKFSDVVILIKDGRILASGTPDEVLENDTIVKLYGLKDIRFDPLLGVMEITSSHYKPRGFVVAGGGTGARLYRALARQRVKVATGIIHENDLDCYVAKSVGAMVICERPFNYIDQEKVKEVSMILEDVEAVVDSGFPVGPLNSANLQLVTKAIENSKCVYTLRSRDDGKQLYGKLVERIIFCSDIPSLIERLCGRW